MMIKKNKIYIRENTSSNELLKEILNNVYHIKDYEIVYNENGKPYLKDIPNLFFNISNKDNITVCVFSRVEVGIDIEKVTYIEGVAKRICNDREWQKLSRDANKEYLFTKLWVLKESYLKMLGEGLSYGMKNIDTNTIEDKVELIEYKNYLIAVLEKR